MVFTPHSELTPEQRIPANTKLRDTSNERKAAEVNELRHQLETRHKGGAAVHSLLHRGNKVFDKEEHRARAITISS